MSSGLGKCGVDTWLGVVPQLIARIHTASPRVTRLLRALLIRIGRKHPQALIYPITVASKTASKQRQEAASLVMGDMRKNNPVLVDEASLVSREMIKVAMTWAEVWHEGLEEASRLYFGDGNSAAMLAKLKATTLPPQTPAAAGLNASGNTAGIAGGGVLGGGGGGVGGNTSAAGSGKQRDDPSADTVRGVAFLHLYGRDLGEAWEWINRYKRTGEEVDLLQAWDIYYNVFRQISKQLTTITVIELSHVAPALPYARGLQLAVPGTYRAHAEVVRIRLFAPTVDVITWSKQRPRRMTIYGGDGRAYSFLLKGREDLRQDERVMQLFGLVNALLASERATAKFNLSIRRYAIMPLSNNSGVIGWVPNCDTLNQLIKQYRESKEIRVNTEMKVMKALAPDYEKLTPLQKLEVFSTALSETDGQDLVRMLWLKSQSAEMWLDRRTNYSQSLAVMCMAGYILGLGDRHPSNIMLDRVSGRVVHIDFGDCFEVAMHRDKFPEKVPFRLTRMLVNAMEVSRIEGMFRSTCEMVMSVMRHNKDSLMAMLEAFVHDPLISWRLLAQPRMSPSYQEPQAAEEDLDSDEERFGITFDADSDVGGHAGMSDGTGEATAGGEGRPRRRFRRQGSATSRVSRRLGGMDPLEEVDRLIQQASDMQNLCQLFVGWCPFW
ncbi:unnamed protein product [Discosporangium mesarthrocarpum]